jgi:hypothetical protein
LWCGRGPCGVVRQPLPSSQEWLYHTAHHCTVLLLHATTDVCTQHTVVVCSIFLTLLFRDYRLEAMCTDNTLLGNWDLVPYENGMLLRFPILRLLPVNNTHSYCDPDACVCIPPTCVCKPHPCTRDNTHTIYPNQGTSALPLPCCHLVHIPVVMEAQTERLPRWIRSDSSG